MTAAKRIASLTEFRQKTNKRNDNKVEMKIGCVDYQTNKNQEAFASSSLQILRAKYEQDGFRERVNDGNYLLGAYRVLRFMQKAWLDQQFCDMYFHVDGEDIPTHKIAVASYSKTLANEFVKFPRNVFIVVEMNGFSKDTVWNILNFIYTTDIEIQDCTVASLLACSRELGIDLLIQMCKRHLENFSPCNALSFYFIAADHNLYDVQNRINIFIREHFVDIVNSPEFRRVTYDQFLQWLTRGNLSIRSELDIFLAIVRWVDFDILNRIQLAPQLLRQVKFHTIIPEVLVTDVEVHKHMFDDRESFNMLYEAMKFHALRLSNSKLVASYDCRASVRNVPCFTTNSPSARVDAILRDQKGNRYKIEQQKTLLSKSPNQTYTNTVNISVIPPETAHMTQMSMPVNVNPAPMSMPVNVNTATMSMPVSGNPVRMSPTLRTGNETYIYSPATFPAAPFNPKFTSSSDSLEASAQKGPAHKQPIYSVVAAGGLDLNSVQNEFPGRCVYVLHPGSNSWELLTTLQFATHHHAVAAVGGKLCVIGGCINNYESDKLDLGKACDTVLIFDPELATWFSLAPMNRCRAYAGVGVLKMDIYVVGGEDENGNKLACIEKYDSTYNRWVFVAKLRGGPRIGAAVCILGYKLFVVGGYNKEAINGPFLSNVECFDVNKQRWEEKAMLPSGICHASLVVVEKTMYLIGGRMMCRQSGTMYSVSSVLRYNEASDLWEQIANMQIPRHDAGCAVVGSKILVVGGMTSPGLECLSSVECYDTASNAWLPGTPALPVPSAGLSCASM